MGQTERPFRESIPCLSAKTYADTVRVYEKWEVDDYYTRNEPDPQKVMEYEYHCMNWPTGPALPNLEEILHNFQQAQWMPWRGASAIVPVDARLEVS